jgi:hypothetical protein
MRGWELILLLIMGSQVSQIFVASIGLFPEDYLGLNGQFVSSNPANATINSTKGYVTGDYNDQTGEMIEDQKNMGTMDAVTLGVATFVSGTLMIITVISTFVTVLPTLIVFFHCPLPLALVLQAIVYYALVWSLAQWKAGRSGGMIQ